MTATANRTYYRNARYFWRIISIAALGLSFLSFPCLRFFGFVPFFRGFGLFLFYSACYVALAGLASLCLFRVRIAEIGDLQRSLTLYLGIVGFRKHLTLGLDQIELVAVTRRPIEYVIPAGGFYWGPTQSWEKVLLFRLKTNLHPSDLRKLVKMERNPCYGIGLSREARELWLRCFPKPKYGQLLSDLPVYGVSVDPKSIPPVRSCLFRISVLLFDLVLFCVLVFWGYYFVTSV